MDERYKELHAEEPFVNDPDISYASPVLDLLDPDFQAYALRLIERGLTAKPGVNTIRIFTHELCGAYVLRDGHDPDLETLRVDLVEACNLVYETFKDWQRFGADVDLEVKGNIVRKDGQTDEWYVSPTLVKLPVPV